MENARRLLFCAALAMALARGLSGVPVAAADEPPAGDPEQSGFDTADAALIERAQGRIDALSGQSIRAISIVLAGKLWKEAPPKLTSVAVGDMLTPPVARAALRELLDSGRYAQAYSDARSYEDGVILRLVVLPRRVVAGVKIIGGELDERRTLNFAELAAGDEVTERRISELEGAIRRYYRRYGYDSAKVAIHPNETDDPMQVILEIEVEAGDRRTISRRVFVIEPKYDRVLGKMKHDYAVESGDPIDEDALREADNEMADDLRGVGFLHAAVKHRPLRKGRHTFLYVYLETGPLYQFVFEGNVRQESDDLEDALDLEAPLTDASAEALAEKVLSYYRNRGFLDARVKVDETSLGDGAVTRVRFRIVEGQPVRVTKRLFSCLPKEPPDDLSADDLGKEIDGVLEENLPGMPLLHDIDAAVVDGMLSPGGSRAAPRRLAPAMTYTPEVYEKAIARVQELLGSKGYLNAVVGPVSIIRAECDPFARGGKCVPLPLPRYPPPRCPRDALDVPLPTDPLPETFSCVPDPKRSVHCAPNMVLDIPVQLGPQTRLYDMIFEVTSAAARKAIFTSKELLEIADFPLDSPFSALELEAAQGRVLGAYKDRGFAYATVRTVVDYSPDRTRSRVRFIVSEHKPVIIDEYEVRGARRTDPEIIVGRLALCHDIKEQWRNVFKTDPEECPGEEGYYREDLVHESEEQIATLGTFSSVAISLEDAHVPQEQKRVIITVVELPAQYVEGSGGFFTGDGFRVGVEWGHRNVGGQAVALTVRLEAAILPEFLILDDDVRENYADLTLGERLERRFTISGRFPNIGLGPRVDLVINAFDARDNQRDFGLTRDAIFPTLTWQPVRKFSLQSGVSAEVNDVTLFNAEDVESAIRANPSLANLLRVPDGRTVAFAQRVSLTWDNRNKPLAATNGGLLFGAVEHVSALPLDDDTEITSEFIKLSARGAFYTPFGKSGPSLALSLAAGINVQLTSGSKTYPDRLFYLGGVNTVRGFQLDEMVPEDVAQQVLDGQINIDDVGVRGGDLYVNPRAEVRVPLTKLFSTGVFLDTGNLWSQVDSVDRLGELFKLRYTVGAGIRIETPLGPIAFDAGFKIIRREWEDLGAVHFSIGLF